MWHLIAGKGRREGAFRYWVSPTGKSELQEYSHTWVAFNGNILCCFMKSLYVYTAVCAFLLSLTVMLFYFIRVLSMYSMLSYSLCFMSVNLYVNVKAWNFRVPFNICSLIDTVPGKQTHKTRSGGTCSETMNHDY